MIGLPLRRTLDLFSPDYLLPLDSIPVQDDTYQSLHFINGIDKNPL